MELPSQISSSTEVLGPSMGLPLAAGLDFADFLLGLEHAQTGFGFLSRKFGDANFGLQLSNLVLGVAFLWICHGISACSK